MRTTALRTLVLASLLVSAPAASAAAPRWAHQASDVPADPAVRYGVLANGMRYAILKNATPPGEASLRLRLDAGSLNEAEDERGLAHFLEHMVLNGTRNVPEGEFVKRLERLGLKFGPDTNASTGFEETVYKLDLPKTDAAMLGEALFLLREVADEASLDAKSIDAERGIILSEERTRASPGYRSALDAMRFTMPGQLVPRRWPIGDPEILKTLPAARFKSFYERYYRPERAVLVAIGDFDPAAVEAAIRKGFESWRGEGAAGREPELGTLAARQREAHVYSEAGLPWQASLSWTRPPDLRADAVAVRRESQLTSLAIAVFNRRMERIATGGAPPFVAAGLSHTAEAFDSFGATGANVVVSPGKWKEGVQALERELRRFRRYGVTASELAREITEFRTSLTAAAAGASTRGTRGLAESITSSIGEDRVFSTPTNALLRFEQNVKGLTPAIVNAAIAPMFSGNGPLVTMTTPQKIAGIEPAMLAALDESEKVAVTPPVDRAAKAWPYKSFGAPGKVVERREIGEGIGATAVRFANGTRLTVKRTDFDKDEVLVSVRFGDGRAGLAPTAPANLSFTFAQAVVEGGLGQYEMEELKQALADKRWDAGFGMAEDGYSFSGSTRPADFALQMEVLAAFFTDPAWRPAALERIKGLADTLHDSMESTPGGVFGRDAAALLHRGDRRWSTPSREEIKAASVDQARTVLAPALKGAPREVLIVGDIDIDQAIAAVARTFGALPAATSAPARVNPTRFPAATAQPVTRTHKGRADQAMAYIAWPTTDFYADMRASRTLNLLADVFQLRLTEEIREKQGATYSPSAGHAGSDTYAGYGSLSASIQAPPDKLAGFLADARKIARALRERPVTADELKRALEPKLASIRRSRASSNGWWLDVLEGVQTDPRRMAEFKTQLTDYSSITPAELQRAAARYLRDDTAWSMVVVPEKAQAVAASPAAR